jgi:hypothetical protein
MRTTTRSIPVLLLATLLGAGACSDSTGPDGGGAAIRQQEALAIFGELMAAISLAMAGGGGAATGDGAPGVVPSATVNPTSISQSAACSGGGTITITGTVNDNINDSGTGTTTFNWRQKPTGCRVTTASGQYTVDGDPDLSGDFKMSFSNWSPVGETTYTMKGGYRYAGSADGRCAVDVSYSMNTSTYQGRIRGSMCGISLDQQF